MSGWIKLQRQLKDWEWYKDQPTCKLFLHLLLTANHKPSRWQGVDILAGQIVVGRKSLAYETGLSEQQIRTALDKLKATSEITIKSTSKYSIISITKWDSYQSDQPAGEPTSNQQSTTNKNEKNEKKKEIYKPDDVSDSVWQDFVAHRKFKKAVITDNVIANFRKEAEKVGYTLEKAIETTLIRGWVGFNADWIKTNESKKAKEAPRKQFNPEDYV